MGYQRLQHGRRFINFDAPTTRDRLLGGRVDLLQTAAGYRVAIDPVLLAASVDCGPAERILDAGCGTGAAALCLAKRVPAIRITGVESDEAAASLARANVAANGVGDRVGIAALSLAEFAAGYRGDFDQAMMNPPYHADGCHSQSPDAGKAASHGEGSFGLDDWAQAAAAILRPGGTLTLIHKADRIDDILGALRGRFGATLIFPLWPRAGVEAKRVLVRAVKGRRTAPRILSGLVLHEADGRYSAEAEAILRDARPLRLQAQGD